MAKIDYISSDEDQPISEIGSILKSRAERVVQRSDLSKLVEKPLLSACEILYDKNIRTYSASANRKDIGRGAYIIIDYDTLSEENKDIAEQKGEVVDYDGGKAVKIMFPLNEDTKVSEINAKSIDVAQGFKPQKATWIPSYSFEDMLLWDYIDPEYVPEDHGITIEYLIKQWHVFYDENSKRFYHSKEHFDKVNQDEVIDFPQYLPEPKSK